MALDEPEKTRIIEISDGFQVVAPDFLNYEIGNALSALVRRKRLVQSEAFRAWQASQAVAVKLISVDVEAALHLAVKFNIYAYDAYFLHCAIAQSSPLLTLDQQMQRIASQLGITVLE